MKSKGVFTAGLVVLISSIAAANVAEAALFRDGTFYVLEMKGIQANALYEALDRSSVSTKEIATDQNNLVIRCEKRQSEVGCTVRMNATRANISDIIGRGIRRDGPAFVFSATIWDQKQNRRIFSKLDLPETEEDNPLGGKDRLKSFVTPGETVDSGFSLGCRLSAMSMTGLKDICSVYLNVGRNLSFHARNGDDSLKTMEYREAESYCAGLGMRLPTSQEWSYFFMQNDSAQVLDSQYPGVSVTDERVRDEIESMGAKGLTPVFGASAMGQQVVDFYYDGRNFKTPYPEADTSIASAAWTVSATVADFKTGTFVAPPPSGSKLAVRCAADR